MLVTSISSECFVLYLFKVKISLLEIHEKCCHDMCQRYRLMLALQVDRGGHICYLSIFCRFQKTSLSHGSLSFCRNEILWIHNYVMGSLVSCLTEMHVTPDYQSTAHLC